MNKTIRSLLCLTLCGVMLLGLCACGDASNAPEHSSENYHAKDSYTVHKNGEGDYDFTVTDYAGNTLFSRSHESHEPQFETLTESVLQITLPVNNDPSMRWAVFCDVRNQKVSNIYDNFLVAKGGYVAQLEYLPEQCYVVVSEIFSSAMMPHTVVTLEGLVPGEDNRLYEKVELNADGNLEITYNTKNGVKAVVVEMP